MKTEPRKFYRISPALSNGKNAWVVHHVTQHPTGESTSTIGYYSLKRAKEVVAHFKKKPIEIGI